MNDRKPLSKSFVNANSEAQKTDHLRLHFGQISSKLTLL
jgi:hypothetical protein